MYLGAICSSDQYGWEKQSHCDTTGWCLSSVLVTGCYHVCALFCCSWSWLQQCHPPPSATECSCIVFAAVLSLLFQHSCSFLLAWFVSVLFAPRASAPFQLRRCSPKRPFWLQTVHRGASRNSGHRHWPWNRLEPSYWNETNSHCVQSGINTVSASSMDKQKCWPWGGKAVKDHCYVLFFFAMHVCTLHSSSATNPAFLDKNRKLEIWMQRIIAKWLL